MKLLFLYFFLLIFFGTSARDSLKFKVSAGDFARQDCPVFISLDQINYSANDGYLSLYELKGTKETRIPCQIENGYPSKLWFILQGNTPKGKTRNFVLRKEKNKETSKKIKILKDSQNLSFRKDGKLILSYRYAITYPPDSVNPVYKRSGFIHPIVSPGGEVLSRIQPPDHFHHYGIWGPWAKTHINEREIDFWNLIKGQGTVKFANFLSEIEGEIFSEFKVLQKHIDFGAKGEDQVALNEILMVRTWNSDINRWVIDYTTTFNCPLPSGILFDAYRYGGGIGFRATGKWHKANCTVLTSEGKVRGNADGSSARWCLIEGESVATEGRSGILFLSYPANRMHPEPMRIWPLDANKGRGDMYFEFCPIRHESWAIENGHDYSLRYRMIVFDGKLSAQEAETYWQAFANPPTVIIIDKK